MQAPIPIVGDWYRRAGGESFEIVAVDEEDATIEVQHFDGTVEEFDFDSWEEEWEEGTLERAEPPEDWTGSVDVEPEDAEDTGNLFAALVGTAGGEVFLDVPQPNRDAAALAAAHGLTPVFETARMYTGPVRDVALHRVYGVTTFELG